jgi:hypothetical protein
MYNLMIDLPSCQSIPVPFRICINLIQFTRSNAFCQSMKHAHNSCSISKVCFKHSKCISVSFSSSKSDLFQVNPNVSLNISSKYTRYYLCCMCDEVQCAMVAAFCRFGFLIEGNHCKFSEILGPPSSFIYVFDRCIIILIPSSPKSLGTSPGTSSSSVAFLSLISLIDLSTSLCKTNEHFLSASTSYSGSISRFSGRLGRS